MEDKIRIFISCHKPCECAQGEFVLPVMQADVVRALESGDGEARFMAARANEYCELLTQYLAWKECGADYIGFGHYRRYFCFADGVKGDGDGIVRRLFLNSETAEELALADSAAISRALDGCDVLAPYPVVYPVGSAYRQFGRSEVLNIVDLDIVLDIIDREFPAYRAAAKKYMRGRRLYYCNMFVMRRGLFCAYSEWLFAVLRRFYERKDMRAAGYTAEQLRTPGHLGERLFGIWLTHLQMQGGFTVRCRPMAVFGNADKVPPLPGPKKGAVSLFLPVDPRSAPFAAAALRSAAQCASRPLDAVFLENGVSAEDREKLAASAGADTDVSVRFCDAARVFSPCAASREDVSFDFPRLPGIFPDFRSALRTDGYTLFTEDITGAERGRFADVSAFGERMPDRARREYYPAKGYSPAFWEVFRQTPFYGERNRAEKCGAERSPAWKAAFRLFPADTRTGCFLRKARRHLRKKR